MKTAILLLVLIFGYITPTYSQLNRQGKTIETAEQSQNNKNADFGNYKFVDKFSGAWSGRALENFTMSPAGPTRRTNRDLYSGNETPCLHPKTGDAMPCFKQRDLSSMSVFKPTNVIWGILW